MTETISARFDEAKISRGSITSLQTESTYEIHRGSRGCDRSESE